MSPEGLQMTEVVPPLQTQDQSADGDIFRQLRRFRRAVLYA